MAMAKKKYPCPAAVRTVEDAEQFVAHLAGALGLAWHPDSPFSEYADTGLSRATVRRLDALADQFWGVVEEPYGFVMRATNKVLPGTYPVPGRACTACGKSDCDLTQRPDVPNQSGGTTWLCNPCIGTL